MPFFSFLSENSDITDITWPNRRRFGPLDKVSQQLMRGPSDLTVAERELIAAYVSALNECQFCFGSHLAVAQEFGVSADLLQAMQDDLTSAPLQEGQRPIFAYVKKLTLSPAKLVQADADAVFQAGWSEQALQDVICIVGLFSFYNRLLDGHGVKGHDAMYNFAGPFLAKKGYGVPWFINWIKGFIKKPY